MNERIGVDALDGAGEGHRVTFSAAASSHRRQTEGGPYPLAARENRITHRAMDGRRFGVLWRQQIIQGAIDGCCARGKKILNIERIASRRRLGQARIF